MGLHGDHVSYLLVRILLRRTFVEIFFLNGLTFGSWSAILSTSSKPNLEPEMKTVASSSETEIKSRKAPCAWAALQDRQENDEKNQVFWKSTQIADMQRLLACFIRVYGEGNAVLNINQRFFTLKVFQPSCGEDHTKKMLKVIIEEMSAKPYRFRFNERNEALYNVYPK